ncbi:hypothetical protein PTTG_08293 [Puccinia triticina 1-1 BBBD Race 1]|uniref:Dynactin subunit 6 n=1 Tax=Puccinia triticina (isolate 1-1 / race 1 (BBBD)) TaxID=630390 RepID=A0A180GU26_PUCT1|nr:hypothetical protein PTTG_08293 [Puccinia triticina 1-1 BBBD Race 1]
MPKIENIFNFHPTAIVAQDVDLVGEVTIGAHCIIHPSCTIVALGPIIFGPGCIVEEQSVICNRRKTTMKIGANNIFSVGSRVEAVSIGNRNVFEGKSRVSGEVMIGNDSVIGAGTVVVSEPSLSTFEALDRPPLELSSPEDPSPETTREKLEIRTLPDFSVIFGERSQLSSWSGEGKGQAMALHAKHLLYLAETLPKFHRIRVVGSSSAKTATKDPSTSKKD